jgi:hypothetical protein
MRVPFSRQGVASVGDSATAAGSQAAIDTARQPTMPRPAPSLKRFFPHSHEILTPRRHTPPPQAVSSSAAVSNGLLCYHTLGWTLSDYATRFTVTS